MKGGIILGASSGVGRELALRLAAEGQQLTAVSRRTPELPDGIAAASADVRDYDSLAAVIRSARDRHAVDYIVNCVGVGFFAPVGVDYLRVWNDILTTNVASLLCLLSIIDSDCADLEMLVQVSSMAAHRPSRTPGNLCYSVSKVAARVIVEEYRKQLRTAGRRTRVSMVSPGFIEGTDFGRNFYAHAPSGAARDDLYGAHGNLTAGEVASVIQHVLHTPERVEVLDLLVCSREQPA